MCKVTLILAVLFSFNVYALTPQETANLKKWQKQVDDPSDNENKYSMEMCGKNLPLKLDASLAAPFTKEGNEAGYYCREVREKLSTMCRNAKDLGNNNKEKVTGLVNSIVCKAGTGDEATFVLKGGVLEAKLGPKASNISEKLLAFMDATDFSTAPKTPAKTPAKKKSKI